LRQIGLATQQVEGVSRRFPIGKFSADPLRDSLAVDRGPFVEVLPFLGALPYSGLQVDRGSRQSGPSIDAPIVALLCPNHDDRIVMQRVATSYGGTPNPEASAAAADYVFNGGANRQLVDGRPPRADGVAIVVVGDVTRQRIDLHSVTGGLSHTLLAWESIGGVFVHTSSTAGVVTDSVELFPANEVAFGYFVGQTYLQLPLQNVATTKRYFFAWASLRIGGMAVDRSGTALLPKTNRYGGPVGLHPDRWASVRCDGSVMMMSDAVDARVVLALATRDES
jgi:hypothetical protein